MTKITYDEYLKLARDSETDDEVVLSYSIVVRGEGGFDFVLKPDPKKVEMSVEDIEFENAMQIGNNLARYRRQADFRRRQLFGSALPVFVSEGDSWFQFPMLVRETIDQLEDDYLIWSVGAAGDTARNMVFGSRTSGKAEYMDALLSQKEQVRGFLFSAAGNDIIGLDPTTQKPVLFDIMKDFNGNVNDVEGHVDHHLLSQKLNFIRNAYTKVIDDIRARPEFRDLPIFIHGYDYPFPYPWGRNDPRDPSHAEKNEWLGDPLDKRGIIDPNLRRNIIKLLIDQLYQRLTDIAGDPQVTGVWLVDCRNAMPNVGDWIDEIHGTSQGFEKVAARFRAAIANTI